MKAKATPFYSFFFLVFIVVGTYFGQASKTTTSTINCLIEIGPDLLLSLGDSIPLQPITSCPLDEIESFSWEPTTFLSCTDCLEPVANGIDDECYTLTINWLDGTTSTDDICVNIEDCDEEFSENSIREISPDQIGDQADITLEIARKQYVRIEIVDNQTVQFPIWEGWLGSGLRVVPLDFSTIPSGTHNLRVRLHPENLNISINKN